MIGETREAIEAYCVAVGLVVYEWNDLHEKLARLFALVREGDRQETLREWYAIRSDTGQREKLRCAITETTSDRWKRSPRAPDDLKWLLDRVDKLASERNNAIHAPCSLYLRGDGSSEVMAAVRSANAGSRRAKDLEGEDLPLVRRICGVSWPVCRNARTRDGLPGQLRMARATKNFISGGLLGSEPQMTRLRLHRLDAAQGRGTMAYAARSGPMLHPSRGRGGRPAQGPARPGESYSEVILRLVELKTSDLKLAVE